MKRFKKLMSLFLATVMLLSVFSVGITVSATDVDTNTAEETPLKIEVETNTKNPSVCSVVEFTVKITNTGDEDLTNITAQTVFDDLSPVSKKKSETEKNVETLKSGESFSYTYRATLSQNNSEINFFEKLALWFVRLFSGGYSVDNEHIDDGRAVVEDVTEFSFGDIVAENVVEVYFEDNEISDEEFDEYLEVSENVENQLDEIQASEEYTNLSTNEKIDLLYKKLSELEAQGLVKNIYYDNSGIEYEYICGISNLIIVDSQHSSDCYSISTNETRTTNVDTNFSTLTSQNNNSNFLFINGLGNSNEEEEASERMLGLVEYYSKIGVPIKYSGNATVNTYKQLSGYDLIYIVSHGSITLFKKTPYIQTSEIVTTEKKETYREDLKNNSVDTFEIKDTKYFRINPSFFENNYPNGELENPIVLLSICKGFGTEENRKDDFGTSFQKAGVSTVIGFYNNARMYYADYLNEKILYHLTTGETVGDAFKKSVNIIGNNSNDFFELHFNKNADEAPTYPVIYGKDYVKLTSETSNILGKFQTTIQNSITKDPIENVSIQIESNVYQFEKTDSNGYFEMELPSGDYYCHLYKNGYEKKSISFEIEEDSTTTDTIYLTPTTITGTVIDSITGRPIPNVWVEATDNNDTAVSVSDFTDENGEYSIPLDSGSYVVGFSHNDYKVEVRDIMVGTDNPYIDIILTPINSTVVPSTDKYNVSGTILDETNDEPVMGVTVEVTEQGDSFSNVLTTTTTDESGRFYVELPEGDYVFSLSHDDYQPSIVPITVNSETADGIMYLSPMDNTGGDDDGNDDNRTVVDSGDCGADGDNVKWTLYDDGELVISGKGKMYDYSSSSLIPWLSVCSSIVKVTIKNGIKNICFAAFFNCSNLTSVTIPNSVTEIGSSAFEYCKSLESLTIPDSVISIGWEAFSECTSLKSIKLPNNITIIEISMFENCTNLANIVIPKSVTEINISAFENCTSLTSVTIPENVTNISISAFANCTSLTKVSISNSVEEISIDAFNGCSSLTNITIPSSVSYIGEGAFSECKNLTKINVDADNNHYSSDNNGVLFDKNKTLLIQYPIGNKQTNYNIPNSVTKIGKSAFSDCTNLININIPNSVTIIENHAFSCCSGLTNITLPSNLTEIAQFAFSECTYITNVTIPNKVTKIDDYAFYDCTSLTDVYYGGNIEEWYKISFGKSNSDLTSATIHYNS